MLAIVLATLFWIQFLAMYAAGQDKIRVQEETGAFFNNSNRRNGSIILKNVNNPDKNSTGNVIERIKSFTGGADKDESASSVFCFGEL